MDERPVDDRGILLRRGNVVEAAEEKHRGGDRAEDGEDADDGERYERFHEPISGVRPVTGMVARPAQKETARNGLCSMSDIARIWTIEALNGVSGLDRPYVETPFVSVSTIR